MVCGENVVRKGRKCMLISAVGSSEMAVGGVVAGFLGFGFFMISVG